MHRRNFLAGAAAVAARPALAPPAIAGGRKTLVFVRTTNPPSYDPVWNTAQATRTLGLMIYEVSIPATSRSIRTRTWWTATSSRTMESLDHDAASQPDLPRWNPGAGA